MDGCEHRLYIGPRAQEECCVGHFTREFQCLRCRECNEWVDPESVPVECGGYQDVKGPISYEPTTLINNAPGFAVKDALGRILMYTSGERFAKELVERLNKRVREKEGIP